MRRIFGSCFTLGLVVFLACPVHAALRNRIVTGISDASRSPVANTVPPRARLAMDLGEAPASQNLDLITLSFNRTPAQQADLDQLLIDQQNPSSPRYHQWLTPQQFGERYGLSSDDIATVANWLASQGLTVLGVSPSSTEISVSGTIGQAERAFGVSIHAMTENGEAHFANLDDPQLPSAIAGVVAGIRGLNDFKMKPHSVMQPRFTSSVTGNHYIAPGDFYTIYDVNPLLSNSINGTGITIAVVGQTDVNSGNTFSDEKAFRGAAGLSTSNLPTLVKATGYKSGVVSADVDEANLDLEWSGALAPNAAIKFVTVGGNMSASVWDALTYAVTNDLAPIISTSYGQCETQPGSPNAATQFTAENQTLQQANAEGITVIGAGGDSGATDCDLNPPARQGLAVDFPASSPYVTAVGGTMFNEGATTGATTYWNTNSSSTVNNAGSATSYIPETAWNETGCTDSNGNAEICAGGGGASILFAKPSWQVGLTPDDSARDVPDISFNAAVLHDPYLFCSQGSCTSGFRDSQGNLNVVGGTSAGVPSMAGVLALLEQQLGTGGLGNINPTIYALASANTSSDAFHDITTGNNAVQCKAGTTNCASGGSIGYNAVTGYDQATGWGSLDVFNFVNKWSSATPIMTAQSITFTKNAPATAAYGTTFSVTATATSGLPVALTVDAASAGVCTLSGSTVTMTSSTGSCVIDANQAGNTNYSAATQVQTTAVATKATLSASAVTVTASPKSPVAGQSVTLTVTVPSGATGTVTLMDGGTALTTINIVPGQTTYTYTIASPTAGTHPITAVYSGDANYSGVTSATATVAVAAAPTPDFTITVSPASVTVPTSGGNAAYTVTVNSVAGTTFANAVTLTASGSLPSGATVSFSPSSVTPGTSGATSTLTITVASTIASERRYSPMAFALLLLPVVLAGKARSLRNFRISSLLAVVLALVATAGVIGCGGGNVHSYNGGTTPTQKTYTITVTGTSGNLSHSTTARLIQ